MRSSGNVRHQEDLEPGDRILEDELALLEAPQLQLVLAGMLRQPGDHVVEILVLDLQRRYPALDLHPLLVGKRVVPQRFPLPGRAPLARNYFRFLIISFSPPAPADVTNVIARRPAFAHPIINT